MTSVAYAIAAYVIVRWLLPVPLTVLHELGHALPGLAFTPGRVTVRVGYEPNRAVSFGRLQLRIRFLNRWRWGWFGNVELERDDLSRGRAAIVLAGGPFVSALGLGGLLVVAALVPWPAVLLVWAAAIPLAWQLVVTAVPMTYPRWFGPYAGRVSDGYRILQLFRP